MTAAAVSGQLFSDERGKNDHGKRGRSNQRTAEIMDTSFAIQALGLEYLAKNGKKLEKKLYNIPQEIDDEVSRLKLEGNGMKIDVLTKEQEAYLSGWE